MTAELDNMKSIWFFVGIILVVFGALVLLAGIGILIKPPATTTVLAHLHPNLWWGGLMIIVGGVFFYLDRKQKV